MNAKNLTIDDLDALLKEASDPKAEAIANADAHTNNVGLPTYSELVKALRDTQQQLATYRSDGVLTGWDRPLKNATELLSRISA